MKLFASRHDLGWDETLGLAALTENPLPHFRDKMTERVFIHIVKGDAWMREYKRTLKAPPDLALYERAIREKMGVTFHAIDKLAEKAKPAGWDMFAAALRDAANVGRAEVEADIADRKRWQ